MEIVVHEVFKGQFVRFICELLMILIKISVESPFTATAVATVVSVSARVSGFDAEFVAFVIMVTWLWLRRKVRRCCQPMFH